MSKKPAYECRFYATKSGAEPVRAWLKGLDVAARREIGADIFYLQEFWPTGMPRVKSLGGGLHEIRSTHDGCEYRVFFCVRGTVLVMLHGIQKKTQKTPARELETARARQKEVERS